MAVLFEKQLFGQAVSVLRQELDSMVRVIYLLSLNPAERTPLIAAAINGEKWKVTDRQMVDVTQKLHGWTLSVYKFGCSFIHLSAFHDYNDRDPLALISRDELISIIQHCRHYHGGPQTDTPVFSDFIPYFPAILTKVSGNLECYLDSLANSQTAEQDPHLLF